MKNARRWLWAMIAALLLLTQAGRLLRAWQPLEPRDFFQEYASARNCLEGRPVYTPHETTMPRYLGQAPDLASPTFVEIDAHPPTAVLLALPLAGLSYRQAHLAWGLLSLLAFALSGWLILRQLKLRPPSWAIFPGIALLLVHPVLIQFHLGQLNLLLLLLITGSWAAGRSDRAGLAGALVGLATAIKLYPGLLLFHFACQRQWKSLVAGVTALAGITLATMSVLGVDAYRSYWCDVLPRLGAWRGAATAVSLPALGAKLFDPGTKGLPRVVPLLRSPELACTVGAIGVAGVLVFMVLASRRARDEEQRDLAFGLALTGCILVAPLSWEHAFVLLALPLALLWIRLPPVGNPRWAWWGLVLVLCLSQKELFRLTGPAEGAAVPWKTLTVLSVHLYAVLGLLAWLLIRLTTAKRCIVTTIAPRLAPAA
jgi:alpha-1,2-mannosyltransferase